jgi:folylpolyglutamate synthase/dihydropteroate synthase
MPLAKLASAIYAVPVSYGQSVPTRQVVTWAENEILPVSEYAVAAEGLADALKCASDNEPVVVCGSLYLVAELRQSLLKGDCTDDFAMVDSL